MKEEIRQALARGYCTKENEHKELDATLIEAMAIEMKPVIDSYIKSIVPEEKKHIAILSNKIDWSKGDLTEHRSVKDWIKYGHNSCRQTILNNHKEKMR